MTVTKKRLVTLAAAVAMLALVIAAVGPVWAQDGTGGQGGTVAIQDDDTLGSLTMDVGSNAGSLRTFFNVNGSLRLDSGQTVTYPAGADVAIPVDRQGANGGAGNTGADTQTTPTAAAGTSDNSGAGSGTDGATEEATPATAAGTSGGGLETPTAAAGTSGGTTGGSTSGSAQPGQTYITQEGDTLAMLLSWMGFRIGDTSTDTGTGAGSTPGATTGTEVATTPTAGTGGAADGTTGADVATTPTADAGGTTDGTTGSDAAALTPTTTGGDTMGSGDVATDQQLIDFVTLNPDLAFEDDQMVTVVGGIPQTGQGQATGTPDSGIGPIPTPGANETLTTPSAAAGEAGGAVVQATPTAGAEATAQATAQATATQTPAAQATPTQDAGGAQATPTTTTDGGQGGTPPVTGGNTSNTGPVQRCGDVPDPGPGFGYYRLNGGESVGSIARRLGVDPQDIIDINPGNNFVAGSIILLPGAEAPGFWNNRALRAPCTPGEINQGENSNSNTTGAGGVGVPVTGANAGQTVGAAGGSTTTQRCGDIPDAPAGFGYYRLSGGESVSSVARRFGVDPQDVIAINSGDNFSAGSIILLPGVEAPGLWNNQALRDFCSAGETSR